jgi:cytochrome c oxidase cbb3-type subunit 3
MKGILNNQKQKAFRKRWRRGLAAMALLLTTGPAAWAAGPGATSVSLGEDFLRELQIMLIMLGVIIFLVVNILILMKVKDPKYLSIKYILGGFVGRNDEDVAMDHEYDGIVELDNPVPAWLRMIMYAGVAFGVIYVLHYHILGTGALQDEEYQIEMAEAELKYKSVELPDDQIRLVTDAGRLSRAQSIFNENCATCHREDLGGDSGPNLTDEFWVHGGEVLSVYHTITNGVEGKAMISWKSRISSSERLELASYILSLQGSMPADPRDPEGTVMGAELLVLIPGDSLQTDSLGTDSIPIEGQE